MVDDLAGKSVGERIRILRERKGMSRETLAGLVGKSASWLKDVERGRVREPKLSALVHLALALDIKDVSQLTGQPLPVPVSSWRQIPHPAIPAIREAIHARPKKVQPESIDLDNLETRVFGAWSTWHHSPTPRADVGRVLPALITDCRTAVRSTEGNDRRRARRLVSLVYALCEQALAWSAEPELVWICADRGINEAQEADTPETIASAAWVLGNVRRAATDFDGSIELIDDAINLIRPYLETGSDDLRGLWGSLHLHQAITYARSGHEGEAWHYWDEANRTAERLGSGYVHPWTVFSEWNVAVHAVSIGADLAKGSTARRKAEQVDPARITSLERRSRLLIETARAYQLQRDWAGSLMFLRQAYQVSPEAVKYQPIARRIVTDAVDGKVPLVQREATEFAQLLGIMV